MSPNEKITYHIDRRREIRTGDVSVFRDFFDASKMSVPGLRPLHGNLQILFTGYDDDRRFPFVIPEIRRYLRLLRRAWPYAVYFCDLEACSFVMLEAIAHIDRLEVVERDHLEGCQVRLDRRDLRRYVRQSHQTLHTLQLRSGLTPAEMGRHIARLDAHLRHYCGSW